MKKISIWIQDFKELIHTWSYYVDKTPTIHQVLTSNKYYFLSRPRRFGKSLTLSLIKYLYLWEKDLFKNTFLYDHWDFTQTHPVVYMSFAGYNKMEDVKEFIEERLEIFVWDEKYKLHDFTKSLNIWFLVQKISEMFWKQVVVLVDEYDKVVLEHLQNPTKAEEYREFFGAFYSWVKDSDPYIKMFLLTWLTKILKMNIFSSLNNLLDISFDPVWYNIMWYNWQDIETNFSEELQEIAKKFSMTFDEVKQKCQLMYNGYNFWNEYWDTIFNPWNINNLILKTQFEYFWSNTGIPSAIVQYVKAKNIDVKDLIEKINTWELKIDEISLKLEYLENILPEVFFLNSGYLTPTKVENNVYTLDFPNFETKRVMSRFFLDLVKPQYDFSLLIKISNLFYQWITVQNEEILKEWFELLVYKFLTNTPYDWINNNPEGWLKSYIWMVLVMNTLGYLWEVHAVWWRKDMVILTKDTYFILEIKVDRTTKEAIAQIEKQYIPHITDGKKIVKVWINWKKEKKEIEVEFGE